MNDKRRNLGINTNLDNYITKLYGFSVVNFISIIMTTKRGKGRPSKFTNEIADEICSRIVNGESLVRITKDDKMPDVVTVYRWLREHKDFCHRYTRAREDQADTLADEIIDIADDGRNDKYADKEDGFLKVDHDHIARSRLRVEARKWVAAKLKPKKYGDSAAVTQINIDNKDVSVPARVSKKDWLKENN